MKIKIFHDWEGKYFAFPDEAETAVVQRSIGMEPGTTQVMTRRDNNGAVTHTRQDLPERWCTTYPSDHPNIPNPTHWGQDKNVLPRKPKS